MSTLQVLYFIPRLRSCFLGVTPDASLEFSLLDELALCFRMLASEAGHACQATNLLRALRQSREATGLGLLEGHQQQGSRPIDIEVWHSSIANNYHFRLWKRCICLVPDSVLCCLDFASRPTFLYGTDIQ